MRVIGGRHRGRTLASPEGLMTRPTTDRVRENLFNILANRISFNKLRVIDLFAGTGTLGFEALSRGSSFCLFVDNARLACAAIKTNIANLDVNDSAQIFKCDATQLGVNGKMLPFNLAFADPPYAKTMGQRAAKTLALKGWLAPGALLVIEENRAYMPAKLPQYQTLDIRSYGKTSIGLFEYSPLLPPENA